jgi:hypothetical protein
MPDSQANTIPELFKALTAESNGMPEDLKDEIKTLNELNDEVSKVLAANPLSIKMNQHITPLNETCQAIINILNTPNNHDNGYIKQLETLAHAVHSTLDLNKNKFWLLGGERSGALTDFMLKLNTIRETCKNLAQPAAQEIITLTDCWEQKPEDTKKLLALKQLALPENLKQVYTFDFDSMKQYLDNNKIQAWKKTQTRLNLGLTLYKDSQREKIMAEIRDEMQKTIAKVCENITPNPNLQKKLQQASIKEIRAAKNSLSRKNSVSENNPVTNKKMLLPNNISALMFFSVLAIIIKNLLNTATHNLFKQTSTKHALKKIIGANDNPQEKSPKI